jgi:hypothetical protein
MHPEALAGDIGDDAGKDGEGDDRRDARLAGVGLDRLRSSWPLTLAHHRGRSSALRCHSSCGGRLVLHQNPSRLFTKIAVIRPGAVALLMTRRLFTPLGTP